MRTIFSEQGQFPTSYFSTTSIEGLVESSSSAVSVSPTSYDDVTQKLSQLFTNELTQIHGITEVCVHFIILYMLLPLPLSLKDKAMAI